MKFKNFFKSIAAVTLAFSLSIPANAAATSNTVPTLEDIAKTNEVNASKYAISFVESMYGYSDLQSGDVLSILNENDNISGYCVDIVESGNPNGYVVIKFSNNQPVVSEFCVEPDVVNPYSSIAEYMNTSIEEGILYSFAPNDYQVYLPQENALIGYDGRTELTQTFSDYKEQVQEYNAEIAERAEVAAASRMSDAANGDYDYIIYSETNGYNFFSSTYEGTLKSSGTITGGDMNFYGSSDVSANNLTYACGVVMLCNLMKYYRSRGLSNIGSNFKTLYNRIYTLAGTSAEGSTDVDKVPDAAIAYLKEVGYKCSYGDYWYDWFSDFKRDVGKNQASILSFGAKFNGVDGGHGVLVVGYLETDKYQYLQVADGWNTRTRYLNYSGASYNWRDGGTFYDVGL